MYDISNEQYLAGCILLEGSVIWGLDGLVIGEDFQSEHCRAIYDAAKAIAAEGGVIDPVSIRDRAARNGVDLPNQFLVELMEIVPTTVNFADYAKRVAEDSRTRRIKALAEQIQLDSVSTPDVLIAKLQEETDRLLSAERRITCPPDAQAYVNPFTKQINFANSPKIDKKGNSQMKNLKKLASLLLALVMVFSLATTAFAAEGDIYEIYQIFTGEVSGGKLINIVWGQNGTGYDADAETQAAVGEDILTALANVNTEETTDAEKLKVITDYVNWESTPVQTGSGNTYTLADGYYLVKNVDGSMDGEGEFYTTYVVEVVDGELNITPKGDAPTVTKTVQEINDSLPTASSTTEGQTVADYDVGDIITFTLTATLPDNINDYERYYIEFVDTMDNMTYSGSTRPTIVFTAPDGTSETKSSSFNWSLNDDRNILTIVPVNSLNYNLFNMSGTDLDEDGRYDLIQPGTTITVTYKAKLESSAVSGTEGNENSVVLKYSNNPYDNSEGRPATGETPPDTVVVFTFDAIINKVDGEGSPLEGAGFTLYKDKNGQGKYASRVGEITSTEEKPVTAFSFNGLDAGKYKLVETTVPEGYNKVDDLYFEIVPTYTTNNVGVTTLTGLTVKDLEGNVISADNQETDENEAIFTIDLTDGKISANVVNNAGTELPETGGMGTTLFYVVGGILVLAAVVLLVTKKRVGEAQ